MRLFSQTVEVEAPPPVETAEGRKEQIERECSEAGQQLAAAIQAEKNYSDAHFERPFPIRMGDTLYVQTLVNDCERQRLQRAARQAIARWNNAWRARAIFENPGLVL